MKNLRKLFIFILVIMGMLSINNFLLGIEKIDINTASAKELEKIIGIGPILAQRIIEARPFYSLEELIKVKGIGPKTLEKIKKEGLAWVDPNLKPPEIEKKSFLEKESTIVSEPFKEPFKEDLKEKFPKFISIYLTALITAIFSAIIILILKKKLKKI